MNTAMQRPAEYGKFWKTHDGGLKWYQWMYDGRLEQHQCFQRWYEFVSAEAPPIQNVLEIGCGLAVGYADYFTDVRYVGIEIAPQLVSWCRENRRNAGHEYLCSDFIAEPPEEQFDVVFSQGTIDNTYDMDAFLQAAVKASNRWVYISAYRGFFPELAEHRVNWCADQGVYYNDISPLRACETLRACGCQEVLAFPSATGRNEIPFETILVARV